MSQALHAVNRFLEGGAPQTSAGLQTTPGDVLRGKALERSGGDLAEAIGLDPDNRLGTGFNPHKDPSTVDMVYYEWCQDILSEIQAVQMQTRPEQIANAERPNADGAPQEGAA